MYRFFRFTTGPRANALPPIERLLSEFGMHRAALQQQRWGLVVSEVLQYEPSVAQESPANEAGPEQQYPNSPGATTANSPKQTDGSELY